MAHLSSSDGADVPDETPFADRLAGAQAGDRSAQGHLLEENRSWIRRAANRMLSPRAAQVADASDMAQSCLATAGANLHQFRGNRAQAFRAWLKTILVNKVRVLLRHNLASLERTHVLPVDADGQDVLAGVLADGASSIGGRLVRDEEADQLRAVLAEFNMDDRQLIEGHFFEGADYAQLAHRLGREPATLRQQVCRALQRLEVGLRLLATLDHGQAPPHYRAVLCGKHLRRLSVAQIGQELQLTEHAARALVQKAEAWIFSQGAAL